VRLDEGRRSLVGLFASVPLVRLGQQASLLRPVLEHVNVADGGVGALDAGLDQGEVPGGELLAKRLAPR